MGLCRPIGLICRGCIELGVFPKELLLLVGGDLPKLQHVSRLGELREHVCDVFAALCRPLNAQDVMRPRALIEKQGEPMCTGRMASCACAFLWIDLAASGAPART